jgi:hypothetical protein
MGWVRVALRKFSPRLEPAASEVKGKCANHLAIEAKIAPNRQFQLLVYACRGRWQVRYHIADNAEKITMVAV